MTDKELKRLSRIELLEIVRMLQQNEKRLSEENEQLKNELNFRRSLISKSESYGNAQETLDQAVSFLNKTVKLYQLMLERDTADLLKKSESLQADGKTSNEDK